MSDAAKTAAKEEEKLADTLAETASAAEAAAAAQEEFVESIDTAAVADLNDTLAEAAETTTNLTEATAENATAAADFANELYDLTLQTLELIKNGETESELYDDLKGKITDLLNANKDYADNPPRSRPRASASTRTNSSPFTTKSTQPAPSKKQLQKSAIRSHKPPRMPQTKLKTSQKKPRATPPPRKKMARSGITSGIFLKSSCPPERQRRNLPSSH